MGGKNTETWDTKEAKVPHNVSNPVQYVIRDCCLTVQRQHLRVKLMCYLRVINTDDHFLASLLSKAYEAVAKVWYTVTVV